MIMRNKRLLSGSTEKLGVKLKHSHVNSSRVVSDSTERLGVKLRNSLLNALSPL